MGRFVNPDNSAFQVALNSKIYVDKTGLIEYLNSVLGTPQSYICNSRPRCFGKSFTANMLTAYYSKGCDSADMFTDLEIGEQEDFRTHLNKYDLLHLDIQWFLANAADVNSVVEYITQSVLAELIELYPDSVNTTVRTIPEALSLIREKHGYKFIVIIDDWDVLIRDVNSNKIVQDKYTDFLRGMFNGTEPTKYIQLAFLTGILPVKKEKTPSALNNFKEYTMLEAGELTPYIGFTESEVIHLCEKYHREFEKVKQWYDGYKLGGLDIYNPKAVVNIMLKSRYKRYWSETGSYEAIVPLINMDFDGLKTAMIEMLSGNEVPVAVDSFQNDLSSFANKDDVLTYLIHLGYLAYDQDHRKAYVPNEEIRQELTKATQRRKWSVSATSDPPRERF